MKEFAASKGAQTTLEDNTVKDFINRTIAQNGIKRLPAVVLDGPQGKTLKTLIEHGYKPSQIFIPNMSKDYDSLKKIHRNTLKATMKDFLLRNRRKKKKLGIAYLDYMCSIGGNTECNPKEDMEILFKNKMLAKGAAFAVTFSVRTVIKNNTYFKHHSLVSIQDYLTNLAMDNRYRIKLLDGGLYRNNKNNMYSLVYKVLK